MSNAHAPKEMEKESPREASRVVLGLAVAVFLGEGMKDVLSLRGKHVVVGREIDHVLKLLAEEDFLFRVHEYILPGI